jgi:SAM-dependent methyltransferase
MSHQESYRQNESYAEFLSGWDSAFYRKYGDRLRPDSPGGRVLDVGCGVGQVVGALIKAGFEAHGVDVSEPNIGRAKKICPRCQLYDGKRLPFAGGFFSSVGALNVLEHVEEPEAFVAELVRVTARGGKTIISSPNFFRVLGFRDYHPHMRGIGNKLRNWKRLREKCAQMRTSPELVRFDRMTPIVKEPFTPDDDAIVATNADEIAFFLKRSGCEILSVECTDRYVSKMAEKVLNAGSWRYLMFNAFVVARKL